MRAHTRACDMFIAAAHMVCMYGISVFDHENACALYTTSACEICDTQQGRRTAHAGCGRSSQWHILRIPVRLYEYDPTALYVRCIRI